MKSIWIIFFAGVAMALLAACSPRFTPFTQRLYDEYRWTENELQRIQFYLSENVVLRREYTGGTSQIVAGEIKIREGREVEEVAIPGGTPGVFLFSPKANRFAVSFEGRGDDKFLMFGPNPQADDRYVLLGSSWDKRSGLVTYDGRKYSVDARSAFAHLMVDLKKVRRVSTKSRTARGREVN